MIQTYEYVLPWFLSHSFADLSWLNEILRPYSVCPPCARGRSSLHLADPLADQFNGFPVNQRSGQLRHFALPTSGHSVGKDGAGWIAGSHQSGVGDGVAFLTDLGQSRIRLLDRGSRVRVPL